MVLGLPFIQLAASQVNAPAAAAVFVTTKADAARPLAANAEPELNPNHPNQSRAAPSMDMGML
jgi:hypothetical protein